MALYEVDDLQRDAGQGALTPSAALTARFRSGVSSPVSVLEETFARIDRDEPRVGAFVCQARDAARTAATASAQRWAAGCPLSPLDGIPVAVKDIIETSDMPTGQGSPLWEGFETRRDAASVQALREAGAVIVGKTTTTEFATTELFARTTNPHDPARTPGGSSSGSAAAVGAGFVPIALGSQVVGSTLRPASYCGCYGFKPTFGALNRGGSYDYLSQSCVGLLGASLEDLWLAARTIAKRVGGDPGHPGLSGPDDLPPAVQPTRLALLRTEGWPRATSGARTAFDALVEELRRRGVDVVDEATDPALAGVEQAIADALPLTQKINAWEFRWPLGTYARQDASKLSPVMRRRLSTAEEMTQSDYAQALSQRDAARTVFDNVMQRYDGTITLAATGAAPVGADSTGDPAFNVPASLLGVPAVSLPILQDEGLPLGIQLLAAQGQDAALFAFARWMVSR
nr:amidase [Paracoccus suum]